MSKLMLFWVISDIDSWQVSQVRLIYFTTEIYMYLFVYLIITNIKIRDQEINIQTKAFLNLHFAVHWVFVCFSQGKKYMD